MWLSQFLVNFAFADKFRKLKAMFVVEFFASKVKVSLDADKCLRSSLLLYEL